MSEQTTTQDIAEAAPLPTERIRTFYVHATGWSMVPPSERPDLGRMRVAQGAEFDRWLAAHDQEVRESVAQEIEADLPPSVVTLGPDQRAGGIRDGLHRAAAVARGGAR